MQRHILYFEIIFIFISFSLCFSEDLTDILNKKDNKTFYDIQKTGWYWYEVIPDRDINKEEQDKHKKSLELPSVEVIWNMYPDDFQALLNDFQKKAVQYPTVSNVKNYLTMQDIARRKASIYANTAAYVVQNTPQFDLVKDYPDTFRGRNANYKIRTSEIEQKLIQARFNFALLYFYSDNCHFCSEQSAILDFFNEDYQWNIKKIPFNSQEALSFNITTIPTLILIKRNTPKYITVSRGVVSLEAIKSKLYKGIRLLNGKITPQQYTQYEYQEGGGFDYEAVRSN